MISVLLFHAGPRLWRLCAPLELTASDARRSKALIVLDLPRLAEKDKLLVVFACA